MKANTLWVRAILATVCSLGLPGCDDADMRGSGKPGGGGLPACQTPAEYASGGRQDVPPPCQAPENAPGDIVVSVAGPKELHFEWDPVEDASGYRLLKDAHGQGDYQQVGEDVRDAVAADVVAVHLHDWRNARYVVEACNPAGCVRSLPVSTEANMLLASGYFKALNAENQDTVSAVALSGDGRTLAVGVTGDDSASSGINGDQSDNSMPNTGSVFVYARESDGQWRFQAYLKSPSPDPVDLFGVALALSHDGSRLVVGVPNEDGGDAGTGGDPSSNATSESGAVFIYSRRNSSWRQDAYIKAPAVDAYDSYGTSVALSADGNRLLVGAPYEDGSGSGLGPHPGDNESKDSGAAFLYELRRAGWYLANEFKSPAPHEGEEFGVRLTMSADGMTLAIAGGRSSKSLPSMGNATVHVVARRNSGWAYQGSIRPTVMDIYDGFGRYLALSADGNTLAVGACREKSSATAINGNAFDNSLLGAGAAYVFTRSQDVWNQQAYVKPGFHGDVNYHAFCAVALSGDGQTLAVGANGDSSGAVGINGDPATPGAMATGAVHVFTRASTAWAPIAYVKASAVVRGQNFFQPALSFDGQTMSVRVASDRSLAQGVNGDRYDQSGYGVGAVYLY
jgi:hypothetical protein